MAAHASNNPQTAGMGATLVAPVFVAPAALLDFDRGLAALSSAWTDGLRQLNEDHSLGPHIDYMVRSGMMPEEIGRNHPDRNALTSVLIGEAIERIDCQDRPFQVEGWRHPDRGERRFAVSVQPPDHPDRRRQCRCAGSAEIAERLLEELSDLDDPEQDNVCFSVIKVGPFEADPKGPISLRPKWTARFHARRGCRPVRSNRTMSRTRCKGMRRLRRPADGATMDRMVMAPYAKARRSFFGAAGWQPMVGHEGQRWSRRHGTLNVWNGRWKAETLAQSGEGLCPTSGQAAVATGSGVGSGARPEAGKSQLVNMFLGEAMVPETRRLPTTEFAWGDVPQMVVTSHRWQCGQGA